MNKAILAQVIAEHLLNQMLKQSFHNWYQNELEDYITCEPGHSTQDEILSDIRMELQVGRLLEKIEAQNEETAKLLAYAQLEQSWRIETDPRQAELLRIEATKMRNAILS